VHDALRPAVAHHRLLERLDDHVCALCVRDAMAHDVARTVVYQNKAKRRYLPDISLNKIQVPEVVRAHRFIAALVPLSLDLRGPIARILHHAPRRVRAHPNVAAAELIDDLARPETRVRLPLIEDLRVPLLLDVLGRRPARRRRTLTRRRLLHAPLPLVDREATHAVLLRRRDYSGSDFGRSAAPPPCPLRESDDSDLRRGMPAPLPPELRERVVAHHEATGLGRILLSQIFSVGSATVYRWIKQAKTTGSVDPKVPTRSGPLPKILDEQLGALCDLVAEKPDRTLKALRACWLERFGVSMANSTMEAALKRANLSLKKKRNGSPIERGRTLSKPRQRSSPRS